MPADKVLQAPQQRIVLSLDLKEEDVVVVVWILLGSFPHLRVTMRESMEVFEQLING